MFFYQPPSQKLLTLHSCRAVLKSLFFIASWAFLRDNLISLGSICTTHQSL